MKILMIGPGIFGLYGGLYYSTDRKIRNGLIRCGHHVVTMPHHDICDSVFGVRTIGRPIADYHTARLARYHEPDVILLYMSHLISKRTLHDIKAKLPAARFINIEVDPLRSEREIRRNVDLKDIVDVTFLTSGGEFISTLRDKGLDVAYLPNPTDTSIEVDAVEPEDRHYDYDLIYVSSLPATHQRWELIHRLRQAEPELRIELFGADRQRVLGEDFMRLLRSSKAGLNWARFNDVDLYASSRIAQLFGIGNCVCMPKSSGYQRFLGANDAIWFDDADDLAASLKSALASGADRDIALSGQKRYRDLFNETRVSDYIVKRTFGEDVSAFEWNDV